MHWIIIFLLNILLLAFVSDLCSSLHWRMTERLINMDPAAVDIMRLWQGDRSIEEYIVDFVKLVNLTKVVKSPSW